MKLEKKYLYLGLFILFFLLSIVYFLLGRKNTSRETFSSISPTEMLIPTIDNSVKVGLLVSAPGKEVLLKIKNIPKGTQVIDYELSYQTAKQGLQGVIGTIDLGRNESDFQKKITLGTCSAGVCVYHEVVGKIKLNLKFTGSYGERVFEKEYEI